MSGQLLLVEDDRALASSLAETFSRRGWEVAVAHGMAEALASLQREQPDVVCADIRPDRGLGLCEEVSARWPRVPVVVVTAFGSMELAVEALRAGAFDFLTKPVDIEVLQLTLKRALRHRRLLQEVRELRRRVRGARGFGDLLGQSEPMRELYAMLERVAAVPSSVLITGESGTGKELVARALHDKSPRARRAFVPINCAAMPEQLLESELFGHVKGAFTDARADRTGLFVQADGGTLFLDEIGDMPLGLQAKLLRVLEDRRVRPVGGDREVGVDVRVVAATHQDLERAAEEGRFRSDLLYRLDVIRVELPPLRERGGDVLLLAQRFLDELATRFDKPVQGFSDAALRRMAEYAWPGNVRELRNCVERAVVLCAGDEIGPDDLPRRLPRSTPRSPLLTPVVDDPRVLPSLAEVERGHIERVVAACGGNRGEAAQVLGIDRKTLYRKLEGYKAATAGLEPT